MGRVLGLDDETHGRCSLGGADDEGATLTHRHVGDGVGMDHPCREHLPLGWARHERWFLAPPLIVHGLRALRGGHRYPGHRGDAGARLIDGVRYGWGAEHDRRDRPDPASTVALCAPDGLEHPKTAR